tara:strand:- start:16426 stop:16581 length:156 start_codon:yes stop_codon:yes gene_type:complete
MMHDLCVLCGSLFVGYGNNPAPLADKGRCCDACNALVVWARLSAINPEEAK